MASQALEEKERDRVFLDLWTQKGGKIFVLSKKEGYANLEISEILNISIKTVENQITIAFKSIRSQVVKHV